MDEKARSLCHQAIWSKMTWMWHSELVPQVHQEFCPSFQIRCLLSRFSVLRLDRRNPGWNFTGARGVCPESIVRTSMEFFREWEESGVFHRPNRVYLGSHSDEGPRQSPGDTKSQKHGKWHVWEMGRKQGIWSSPHIFPESWWWARWTLSVGTELGVLRKPSATKTLSSGNCIDYVIFHGESRGSRNKWGIRCSWGISFSFCLSIKKSGMKTSIGFLLPFKTSDSTSWKYKSNLL